MAVCLITGVLQNAAGEGVPNVPVRLVALPEFEGYAEIVGNIGLVLDQPVEVLTNLTGNFEINAVQGGQFRLIIDAIGLDLPFRAPKLPTISFHLLGLKPELSTKNFVADGGGDVVDIQVLVSPEGTVIERFDQVVIRRGPAASGPWTTIATLDLRAGERLYEHRDLGGGPASFYSAYFVHSVSGDESEDADPVSGESFAPEAAVLSVEEFLQTYLFGLDMTDDEGKPYPPIIFQRAISYATAWMEHALDIKILAHDVVDEAHDYYAQDWEQWGWLNLHEYPIQRVDAVKFQFPHQAVATEMPAAWLQIEKSHGVVNIVPGQGDIASILLMGSTTLPLWGRSHVRLPGLWKVSYRAGFEPDDVPEDIRHVIGMLAALPLLNVAGDLVGGAGLQGWSVSLPGLSQSITTTNSSTNAGYGARLLRYLAEIKFLLPTLKDAYGKRSKIAVA